MAQIVADRFLPAGAAWLDLATGTPAKLRFLRSGSRLEEFAWNDRCAALSLLRHPLLNTLVDYGHADAEHAFEAFAAGAPVAAPGAAGGRLLTHVARFLEGRAIPLDSATAGHAMRPVVKRPARAAVRPVGIVLQPRRLLDGIAELLAAAAPGGVARFDISGERGSGLSTARLLAARLARLEGFLPLDGAVLARWPWVARLLEDRHLCVFVGDDGAGGAHRLASLLGTLGLRSTRRHVVLRFHRDAGGGTRLVVDPLGVRAMTSMVYLDPHDGPSEEEVLDAARAAHGNPGRFLEQLGAARPEDRSPPMLLVHESSVPYVTTPDDRPALPAPAGGGGRTLEGAPERAARLAARGRHARAIRLLARASRVLEARGEAAGATACLFRLGWILRDRGRLEEAVEHLERARLLAANCPHQARTPSGVMALVGLGVLRTDAQQLEEAEAILRSAQTAAGLSADSTGSAWATVALGRCLFWRRRLDEAAAVLHHLPAGSGAEPRVHALALTARIDTARGESRSALIAAGESLAQAPPAGLRAIVVAARSMAVVQLALGDPEAASTHVRRGLEACARAHLPLYSLRLRAILLDAMHTRPQSERMHVAVQLRSALARRALPALLCHQVEEACRRAESPPTAGGPGTSSERTFEELQRLLEVAHSAPDDASAVEHVCRTVAERLEAASVLIVSTGPDRRTLAQAGRHWPASVPLTDRVLATGRQLPTQCDGEPLQAGELVAYAGEPVAAILCRWPIGRPVEDRIAAATLRAGALAVAHSVRSLRDRDGTRPPEAVWGELIGTSPAARELREAISRAARAPFPVLVEGESGTGKELVARAVHRLSARRERRLCAVNCAALSDDLLEAELFGHARGAFTGAIGERAGLFEEADGGTLLLDEVGELSARAQAKLLRVLQDGEVRRVGENIPRRVDARIVAATNRRLDEDVDAGRFRADLRFRLDVIRIAVPPLRERPTDIPALAAHFWDEATRRVGSRATLTPETTALLTRYDWPGNVRQLQNVLASLAVHAPRRGRIGPDLLPAQIARSAAAAETTFEAAREEFERRFIRAALARSGGQRARAARALGVSRQGLAKMLRRLRMDV